MTVARKKKRRTAGPPRSQSRKKVIALVGTICALVVAPLVASALSLPIGNALDDWRKDLDSTPTARPSPPASAGPPITVETSVKDIPEEHFPFALGSAVTSPADRAALQIGTDDAGLADLIRRHRGAPVGITQAKISITSHTDSVAILDMRVKRRKTSPAPPLSAGYLEVVSAGGEPNIALRANLDQRTPVFLTGEKSKTPYFTANHITLDNKERAILLATFTASRGYHEFDLIITYLGPGSSKEQTIVVSDHGRPFKITGAARGYDKVYVSSGGGFQAVGREAACRMFPGTGGC